MYKYLLFDLDGTLTDSREGIFKCVEYSLDKMGIPVPDEDTLLKFIGPPLVDSYMEHCGMTREQGERALEIYRERYSTKGLFENAPVEGAAELLKRLKKKGFKTAIASSKPEFFVVPICEKFGFAPWLDVISGSENGLNEEKCDVIFKTFKRFGIGGEDLPEVLMIGDRKYDVEGAKICGIDCAGVRFLKYAPEGELEAAGATAVYQTIEEFEKSLSE